ncbi:MAG: hypothetical protein KZQ58_10010 [gamma proteobacterium symbiont of Bathyaustriella thionipta]|nr:hypothetical protein [gamma proteobacterium symbiont of Bathyaustriella thionipta]
MQALQKSLLLMQADPHSAASLTLYALICTLEIDQAGCLFKLTKLRDLPAEIRPLAYELMELMVAGQQQSPSWQTIKQQMDALIRAA